MSEAVKEILELKEDCDYKRISVDEILVLRDYITNLQEENKEAHDFDETMKDIKENLIARIQRQECEIHNLKAKLEMYENGVYFSSENDELQQRIERLNNIINELEKWLEEQIKISQAHDNELGVNVCNTFKNKLNELKGDSSNE